MNKKHFIILGRVGLIYYSWVLIIFFISLIIIYEGTEITNWPALFFGILFFLILLYTYQSSYWTEECLKLPFKEKTRKYSKPKISGKWRNLKVYEIKVAELEKYYLLRFEKN